MSIADDEQFIISQIVRNKKNPNTMHELARPTSIQGRFRDYNAYDRNDFIMQNMQKNNQNQLQKQRQQGSRLKSRSKQNQLKHSQKCVRIATTTGCILFQKQRKGYSSSKNLTSLKDIQTDQQSQSSIDEINLVQSTQHAITRNKKSNLSSKKPYTIKSFRDIPNNSKIKSQRNVIKSSKSIKFSDKKDVFLYKSENKSIGDKQKIKNKLKSMRRCQTVANQDEQCCQII